MAKISVMGTGSWEQHLQYYFSQQWSSGYVVVCTSGKGSQPESDPGKYRKNFPELQFQMEL